MTPPPADPPATPAATEQTGDAFDLITEPDFAGRTLTSDAGVAATVLANGCLHSITVGDTLVNLLLGHPLGGGMHRLYLRRWDGNAVVAWHQVLGPGSTPSVASDGRTIAWTDRWDLDQSGGDDGGAVRCRVTLALHDTEAAWSWQVRLTAEGDHAAGRYDAVLVQDLGLASRGQVLNNEAYTSQYVGHQAFNHPRLGTVVAARQNLPQGDGNHPFVMHACLPGAAGALTDGHAFFGPAFRATNPLGPPAAITRTTWEHPVQQHELSCHTLVSQPFEVTPADTTAAHCTFLARFVDDHPAPANAEDLHLIDELLPLDPTPHADASDAANDSGGDASGGDDFTDRPTAVWSAPAINCDDLTDDQLDTLISPERRHVERLGGAVASFFHGNHRHAVLRRKELHVLRRHAHLLHHSPGRLPSTQTLCVTAYMAGPFASHLCLGNTNFNKLLPVSREPLGLTALGGGLRIWVHLAAPGNPDAPGNADPPENADNSVDSEISGGGGRAGGASEGGWHALTVPSAFDMGLTDCRWLYRFADHLIELTATINPAPDSDSQIKNSHSKIQNPHITYTLAVPDGLPLRFLLATDLTLGDRENQHPGRVAIDADAPAFTFTPHPDTLLAGAYPDATFTWSFDDTNASGGAAIDQLGGDELLYPDHTRRRHPLAAATTHPTRHLTFTFTGHLTQIADTPALNPKSSIQNPKSPSLSHPSLRSVASLADALPWFAHNAGIHLAAPHGLEQYSGAAWGVRDACQGPFEWLLSIGETTAAADLLADVFSHQYHQRGDWPQWYMHPPFQHIQSPHAHGDVAVWPLIATAQYLHHTGDTTFLDRPLPYTQDDPPFAFTEPPEHHPVRHHLAKAIARLKSQFIEGTHLPAFGDGDWNDSLQPAQPDMRHHMVSTWTVELFFQALRSLATAPGITTAPGSDNADADLDPHALNQLADRLVADTNERLIADGQTAGLYLHHDDIHQATHLLHPRDTTTGIHHRLLPMIRGILSNLFTPDQAHHHLSLIREHLLAPDGARLFDKPPRYRGGTTHHFQRAESAAFFGREVGLMYTHAHLRYAQALAHLGLADDFYHALLVVNPVGLRHAVSNALPRQANVYFSSSDAAFANRREAEARYPDLMQGDVPVHGGWRLYSSGPGIFLHLIQHHLLGLRPHGHASGGHASGGADALILDPILPAHLTGLTATTTLALPGAVKPNETRTDPVSRYPVTLHYTVKSPGAPVTKATLNGTDLTPEDTLDNPYRPQNYGGSVYHLNTLRPHLHPHHNTLHITCG